MLVLAVALLAALDAHAQHVSDSGCPPELSSVGPPDQARISAITEGRMWTNAFVLVNADGYELIFPDRVRRDERIGLRTLRRRLLELPKRSWDLGRVVAGSENGVSLESDKPVMVRRTAQLRALLETMCVRFDQWPSA
jgi:hypothetical protein